jgi:hypothetical protein
MWKVIQLGLEAQAGAVQVARDHNAPLDQLCHGVAQAASRVKAFPPLCLSDIQTGGQQPWNSCTKSCRAGQNSSCKRPTGSARGMSPGTQTARKDQVHLGAPSQAEHADAAGRDAHGRRSYRAIDRVVAQHRDRILNLQRSGASQTSLASGLQTSPPQRRVPLTDMQAPCSQRQGAQPEQARHDCNRAWHLITHELSSCALGRLSTNSSLDTRQRTGQSGTCKAAAHAAHAARQQRLSNLANPQHTSVQKEALDAFHSVRIRHTREEQAAIIIQVSNCYAPMPVDRVGTPSSISGICAAAAWRCLQVGFILTISASAEHVQGLAASVRAKTTHGRAGCQRACLPQARQADVILLASSGSAGKACCHLA